MSQEKRIKLEHPPPSPPAVTPIIDQRADLPPPEPLDPVAPEEQYHRRYLLRGHSKAVSSVKFSPDGKYLASACKLSDFRVLIEAADKLIKLWDSRTGEFVQNFEGHTKGISDIAWSSSSDLLASGSDDKTVRLWNVTTV